MKKLLLTFAFISLTALSHAQGTIAFGNSALTRILVCDGQSVRNATAADGLTISVWFGPAGSGRDALTQAGTAPIGSTPGVLTGAPSVFALPGTEPNQVVSLQIRATGFGGGFFTETEVRQVTLGQTAGPGAVIWQTATGTNPNRFTPLIICPEPSTIALGALGGLALLFRLRRTTRTN